MKRKCVFMLGKPGPFIDYKYRIIYYGNTIVIKGVYDIKSYDDNITVLKCDKDYITVNGEKLEINSLDADEIRIHGKIQWIDSFKLAPYLSSGNYHAAERILSSILQQHLGPDVWTTNPWTEIDYEIYRSRYPGKDEHLLLIYDWIHNKDISAIQSYLSDNFVVNSSSNKLT